MSDYFIRICSTDPCKKMDEARLVKAVEYLKQALHFQDVCYYCYDNVQFIDCGVNLEELHCPFCNEAIDFSDVFDRMNDCFEVNNNDLSYTTACCGKQTRLSDLVYDFNCGFGRYVIELDNPNMDHVPQPVIDELQSILDDQVQLVFAHY